MWHNRLLRASSNSREKGELRTGFTLVEMLVVITIIGIVVALLMPAVSASRESDRRTTCVNNFKQISLAILTYAEASKVLPPGTICATSPVAPGNQYDVWGEAAKTGPGFHGTSFLLQCLPFLEQSTPQWDFTHGVAYNAPQAYSLPDLGKSWCAGASIDLSCFYCPTRRSAFRPADETMTLSPTWTGGGTDYGGCAGRHAAFTHETGYNLCDASMVYSPDFSPISEGKCPLKWYIVDICATEAEEAETRRDTIAKRWGIFGRVNVSTKFREITDGTSHTIMTGELQRIWDVSKDGWAIGGPATLFTTGALMHYDADKKTCTPVASANEGTIMNNHFFGSPGSEHSDTVNFGLADGSVRSLSTTMDPNIFALLGSMADGTTVGPDTK